MASKLPNGLPTWLDKVVPTLDQRKPKPGCTLVLNDEDLVSMASGQLDSMKAFMGGKLKITGNVMLAQKLKALFEQSKGATVGTRPTAVSLCHYDLCW